ncbi:MAG: hypothetical protein ACYC7E_19565 [Armatimonadota bacterium]
MKAERFNALNMRTAARFARFIFHPSAFILSLKFRLSQFFPASVAGQGNQGQGNQGQSFRIFRRFSRKISSDPAFPPVLLSPWGNRLADGVRANPDFIGTPKIQKL